MPSKSTTFLVAQALRDLDARIAGPHVERPTPIVKEAVEALEAEAEDTRPAPRVRAEERSAGGSQQ
jgi:hypothetical protein